MLKTFKYRLFPTKKQTTSLEAVLEECRYLYNRLLEQRKYAWEIQEVSLGYRLQQNILPAIKTTRNLQLAHSQVLQNVALRVDLAFKAFFRRVKGGEKPGYPRFKGKGWYDSITFPQVPSGCRLKDGRLSVSKVGHIKIVMHREMCGRPKTATIRRSSTGKWYVIFSCEVETQHLPACNKAVGIDVGEEARDQARRETEEALRKAKVQLADIYDQVRAAKSEQEKAQEAVEIVVEVQDREGQGQVNDQSIQGTLPGAEPPPDKEMNDLEARIKKLVELKQHHDLSDRQASALKHILEHGIMTIQDFEHLCPDVSRRTLQADLKVMVDQGLLISEGATDLLKYQIKG